MENGLQDNREFKRGEAPLSFFFPLSFMLPRKERGSGGEADTDCFVSIASGLTMTWGEKGMRELDSRAGRE
jgi:hypothetical protein